MKPRFFDEVEIIDVLPTVDGNFYVLLKEDEKTQNCSNFVENQSQNLKLYNIMNSVGLITSKQEEPKNISKPKGNNFKITKENGKFEIYFGRKKIPLTEISALARGIVSRPYLIHKLPDHVFESTVVTKNLYDFEHEILGRLLELEVKFTPDFQRRLQRLYYGVYGDFDAFCQFERKQRKKINLSSESPPQPNDN